ncbi:MAG: LSU ribosomal protein L19p, partial [uncultured Rubrobacteraceae bacterium]
DNQREFAAAGCRLQAGRHGEGALPRHRGQPREGPGLRGPVYSPQGRRYRRDVHRTEELLRGERGADLPAPLPEDRGHPGLPPGRGAPGEALLHPRQGGQEGPRQEGPL